MKYLLVLYICSITTNQCPSSNVPGYSFASHYDCVDAGYAIAQKTFRNLKEYEEWNIDHINKNKFVIKFECKEVGEQT